MMDDYDDTRKTRDYRRLRITAMTFFIALAFFFLFAACVVGATTSDQGDFNLVAVLGLLFGIPVSISLAFFVGYGLEL